MLRNLNCLTIDDNNNDQTKDSINYEVQDAETFRFADHVRPLVAANCSEYAVAHSNVHQQPVRQLCEISFLPHILQTMSRLKLTQILRLQSYAWPHLSKQAGHGAVLVSAPRSGRTLSYVPPLCQQVCIMLTKHRSVSKLGFEGPMAIVLAADLGRVQRIGSLCNGMLRKAKNEEWLTLALMVPSAFTPEFFYRLLNGVGCLVATPAQLLWLCSNFDVKLPNLSFLAYDDVDLMVPEQLQQAHHKLKSLAQQRPQLVITTQSYNVKLLAMLRDFNDKMLLLFGDMLEAAAYGGVRLRISLLKHESKLQNVLQLLEQRPPLEKRTAIYCHKDKDIRELADVLELHGYCCLPYYQSADWEVREHVRRWMDDSCGELLLCTDNCPELDMRHVQTLVHYSLSDNWSKFKLRHLALSDNLHNQLEQPTPKQLDQQTVSLVLLDEHNNKQLPRLVDFLQQHQAVDERIVQLSQQLRTRLQSEKCNEPTLCDLLLSLGHCSDSHCEQRHHVLPCERELPAGLPYCGDVKLQLLKAYSPTHYSVRLLEHLPPAGKWRNLPARVTLELELQLLQSQKCVRHWPPRPKQICVYRNATGFERVRILCVAHIENVNLSRTDVAVEVQAMDVNTRRIKTTSGDLYICPEPLRAAPALAMDLRILGLVPYTGEREWHKEDANQCAKWLNAVAKPNFLQASIVVALSHTIFVRDLAAINYAPSMKMFVRTLNMSQQLAEKKLAKKCQLTVDRLMTLLNVAEIKLNDQQEEQQQEQQQSKTACLDYQKHQDVLNAGSALLQKQTRGRGRGNAIAQMALQLGRENRLRIEQEQQQQLDNKLKQLEQQPQLQTEPRTDSVQAFFDCIRKCDLLDAEERQLKQTTVTCSLPDPQFHMAMPKNVVRPQVSYYQTKITLELQLLLSDDNLQYEVVLFKKTNLGFWTLDTEPTQQCILKLPGPFVELKHFMRGRTVYLSVLKAYATSYPLEFSCYKFMKPHYDKINAYEEQQHVRAKHFELDLLEQGYVQKQKPQSKRDDELADEEPAEEDLNYCSSNGEKVERAYNRNEFELS
ncbi:BoYb [Drosophila busckii]|uniref:RNA helicase n=1 Tax=Drosophila busckii TaxID=30019 RepID=A0A0M4EEV6_DROBS|nr:BoYb [Drosophila busckii]